MVRRSRFFLNSFLRLPAAAAAGFPAAPASGVAFVDSFATSCSVSRIASKLQRTHGLHLAKLGAVLRPYMILPGVLALLAGDFLLGCNGAAARTLAGASVGVRALATNRQIAAMTNAAIRLNFDQAPNVHLDLFAEISFDAAFLLDLVTEPIDLVFGQIANLFRRVNV